MGRKLHGRVNRALEGIWVESWCVQCPAQDGAHYVVNKWLASAWAEECSRRTTFVLPATPPPACWWGWLCISPLASCLEPRSTWVAPWVSRYLSPSIPNSVETYAFKNLKILPNIRREYPDSVFFCLVLIIHRMNKHLRVCSIGTMQVPGLRVGIVLEYKKVFGTVLPLCRAK